MITKDAPEGTLRALASVYETLYEEGDEAVVLDTGSSPENLEKLRKGLADFRDARLITVDLAEDFTRWITLWMPENKKAFLHHYPDGRCIPDFSAARQMAQDAAKNPIIFWIDSDDIIEEATPGAIRSAVKRFLDPEKPESDAVFLDYLYMFDPDDGTCTTTLRRERFFFKDRYYWAGRCHETAIPAPGIEPRRVAFLADLQAAIRHVRPPDRHRVAEPGQPGSPSDIRNYVILRRQYEEHEETEARDPRTIFYLGNAARGLRRFAEARQLYKEFDRVSGSPDDRFAAKYYTAGILLDPEVRRPADALAIYYDCIDIKPADPRGYYGISRAYAGLYKWPECLHWYKIGGQLQMPETQIFSFDPTHVNYHPHILATHAAKELNRPNEAVAYARRAAQFRPNLALSRQIVEMAETYARGYELSQSVTHIGRYLKHGGPNAERVVREITSELMGVPAELEKMGIGKIEPPDPRPPRPELVILCGGTLEEWGPHSRFTGCGGSEKMVILISEALQAAGHWNVSVYANVPKQARGVAKETGVLWRHFSEFDPRKPRDVAVVWRTPEIIRMKGLRARKRMIWLHDVPAAHRYTPEILALADLIQVQSHFQGAILGQWVPEEKIWVARNAIEIYQQKHVEQRNPKQVLYCSSPDRGLFTAGEVVRKAKEIDPEIDFHVAYGFTEFTRKRYAVETHMAYPDMGHETSCILFERDCFGILDELGGTMHHKLNFEDFYKLMLLSGVWLYPTRFPEISCMAAMEAQALGMVPVATRFAALAETILPELAEMQYVAPLIELPPRGRPPKNWYLRAAQTLVAATKISATDPRRLIIAEKAWERYGIEALAEEWTGRLAEEGVSGGAPSVSDRAGQTAEPPSLLSDPSPEERSEWQQSSNKSSAKSSPSPTVQTAPGKPEQ